MNSSAHISEKAYLNAPDLAVFIDGAKLYP